MVALDNAFLVLVKVSKVSSRELALFLPEALVLGVEPSDSYKTARSVTLVGDLAPANASISICVQRLSEGLISGDAGTDVRRTMNTLLSELISGRIKRKVVLRVSNS
jgi:hypothetical protein